jgi:hypothetical protein
MKLPASGAWDNDRVEIEDCRNASGSKGRGRFFVFLVVN